MRSYIEVAEMVTQVCRSGVVCGVCMTGAHFSGAFIVHLPPAPSPGLASRPSGVYAAFLCSVLIFPTRVLFLVLSVFCVVGEHSESVLIPCEIFILLFSSRCGVRKKEDARGQPSLFGCIPSLIAWNLARVMAYLCCAGFGNFQGGRG